MGEEQFSNCFRLRILLKIIGAALRRIIHVGVGYGFVAVKKHTIFHCNQSQPLI